MIFAVLQRPDRPRLAASGALRHEIDWRAAELDSLTAGIGPLAERALAATGTLELARARAAQIAHGAGRERQTRRRPRLASPHTHDSRNWRRGRQRRARALARPVLPK